VTKGWCMFETKEAVQDTEYYGNKTTFLDFRPETFEKTTLHDGTVIYRFSKELLAYIETLVAFCPYYRQDDPRTAGALDEFYNAALQDYAAIKYDALHEYLIRRLTAWYKKFEPAVPKHAAAEAASLDTAKAGDVVSVEGDPAQTKPRFSLNADDPSSTAATPEEEAGQGAEGGEAGKEGTGGDGGRGE
jgi:hypothetical protein